MRSSRARSGVCVRPVPGVPQCRDGEWVETSGAPRDPYRRPARTCGQLLHFGSNERINYYYYYYPEAVAGDTTHYGETLE